MTNYIKTNSTETFIRNPENPFVYNPQFWSNSPPYEYTFMHLFHRISNIGAFFIGVTMVFLLAYLILTKTPDHFKSYSKVLLLCVVNDFIILVVHSLIQTRMKMINGVILIAFRGPLSYFSYSYQKWFMSLQGLGATIALASLPIQYYYRYMLLKLKRSPPILKIIIYYVILISFVFMFMFLCGKAYSPRIDEVYDFDYAKLWYEENPVPQLMLGCFVAKWMDIACTYCVIWISTCYCLIIWLARATLKELKAQEYALTERTKVLQTQFSRALMIQALTPLLTTMVPFFVAIFGMLTNTSTGYAGEFVIMAWTWFPAINSMCNILFIGPYKNHAIKMFTVKFKLFKPTSVSMVSNQMTTAVNTKN